MTWQLVHHRRLSRGSTHRPLSPFTCKRSGREHVVLLKISRSEHALSEVIG
jgi:hypothetical protein